jgi:ABC-2 type transport system ATP-binding protein
VTESGPVIELARLVKSFGSTVALQGLDLAVPPGAVGLLGPNGAGKTTLIKLLLGLLQADSGEARIAGLDPSDKRQRMGIRRRVGYMPEGDCLLPRMSAVDLVSTLGRITGLSPEDAMTRAHETLDYVGLEEARYRELTEYSTGMKQRLKLAQALVHDPELLLLDEPTNGLDPKGRRHMLALIRDLGHELEKNVLLCSHLLPDVERTCEHVLVIDHGRVVKDGALAELTGTEGHGVRVRLEDHAGRFERELLGAGRTFERERDGAFRITVPEGGDADDVFALAAGAGVSVEAVEVVRSTLEDVFMEVLSQAGESA